MIKNGLKKEAVTAKEFAASLSTKANTNSSPEEKKLKGQYFTSEKISEFMASLAALDISKREINVLDTGAGTGMLVSAIVDRIIKEKKKVNLNVDLFESDETMIPYLSKSMDYCEELMNKRGYKFNYRIIADDYIIYHSYLFENTLLTEENDPKLYDLIIGNPPYFKVNKRHIYSDILSDYVHGQPNVYFMFMVVSKMLLDNNGQIIYITPRSYTSGAYFEKFREEFFKVVDADHIHVFNSRRGNFKGESVLQENIILSGFRRKEPLPYIMISSSSTSHIEVDYEQNVFNKSLIFDSSDQINLIRLPLNEEQAQILELFDRWSNTLSMMNMNISTGPVVTFRNRDLIEPYHAQSNPLIHMRNLRKGLVEFNTLEGEEGINDEGIKRKLLVPSKNYILLKRFTSKEQKKRIDSAVYDAQKFDFKWIGLENHLNYIYREDGELTTEELYGLFAFLNSELVDKYFRIVNGNTQVNASDIRPLPLPDYDEIIKLGRLVLENGLEHEDSTNFILNMESNKGDIKLISKEEEALDLLEKLELPKKQQNQRSALTLLSLLNLKENDSWDSAQQVQLRVVDIMNFMAQNYGKEYAPNSRETIRRQTIHQFEQAQLIVRNADDPSRPTNSGLTVYSVSDEFLLLAKSYGTNLWEKNLEVFKSQFQSLTQRYEVKRKMTRVPINVDGEILELSPGEHNKLQKDIVDHFAAYFAPGSELLYLGDTENKNLYNQTQKLIELNVPYFSHNKLPDVVLYDSDRNWLFLIEAVTSHGPISSKRKYELEKMFENCTAGLVFVTAFPDMKKFKKYSNDLAWETEVWFSDQPKHMMHLNGDRFLGPR